MKHSGTYKIPQDLVEQAQQVREQLLKDGKMNVQLGDIIIAAVRKAFKTKTEISVNKVWTFERVFYLLKKSEQRELLSQALTKENYRAISKVFEERSKETDAAVSDCAANGEAEMVKPARKRRSAKRNLAQIDDQRTGSTPSSSLEKPSTSLNSGSMGEKS